MSVCGVCISVLQMSILHSNIMKCTQTITDRYMNMILVSSGTLLTTLQYSICASVISRTRTSTHAHAGLNTVQYRLFVCANRRISNSHFIGTHAGRILIGDILEWMNYTFKWAQHLVEQSTMTRVAVPCHEL